jgi:hypothetical protein
MTKPRSKSETLSATTITKLKEIYIEEVYGRKKEITTKFMDKGTAVETDSFRLYYEVTGTILTKNIKTYTNAYLSGTPDDFDKKNKIIYDVKSSWDIFTFAAVDEKKAKADYYWQMWGYMWLTGATQAHLIYALVDTPETLKIRELERLAWKEGVVDFNEIKDKYINLYEYNDIPAKKRIKEYIFTFDPLLIDEVTTQLDLCRRELKNMDL